MPESSSPIVSAGSLIVNIVKGAAGLVGHLTRPSIRFLTRGDRSEHRVNFRREGGGQAWPAIKLRLLVRNAGWFDIPNVQIYLKRVEGPGGLLVRESFRLIWSIEENDQWLTPKTLFHGTVGDRYVDLCSVDERSNHLQIMSESYLHGGHRFTKAGIYTLHVQAVVPRRAHGKETRIRVAYDPANWMSTRILDATDDDR